MDDRNKLTPFLRAVTRALSIELEQDSLQYEQKEAIFNEILQILRNEPAENYISSFLTNLIEDLIKALGNVDDFSPEVLLELAEYDSQRIRLQ